MTTYGKNARRTAMLAGALAGALAFAATTAEAQTIAQRVAGVRTARAEIRFAAREGVCGDGRHFVRMGRNSYHGAFNGDWSSRDERCMPGPVRVVMRVEGGSVSDLHTYVGTPPTTREADITDLGDVPARDAAAWLLQVARRDDPRGERALLGAVLADSATVWPGLVAIARADDVSRNLRREATFWLSRFASARSAGHADRLWSDDEDEETPEVETKKSAVFALSQLQGNEGVEPLLTIARTNREPAVRRQAMFWLSQKDDRRAVDLFEEILKN